MTTVLDQINWDDMALPEPSADTRIVVAMSGGVDSSVVAGLLKHRGYETIGITLQLYDHGKAVHRKRACCAGQDIQDARRVAEKLDIPHYVLNYEKRFAEEVINEFADSYAAGETPIPCVNCNQEIKFKDLLNTARELGATALATGHYVDSRPGARGRDLYRARDLERDQSYFLFSTPRQQLNDLIFPLGRLTKPQTRDLAEYFDLEIASKPDSQDICFVPSGKYSQVIEKLRPEAGLSGNIVHVDGRVLARHDGIIHYTIGQRRGIGVATGEPLYVVRIDAARKEVVVGPKSHLATNLLTLRNVNWLGDDPLEALAEDGVRLFVKVRSTQNARPALLRRVNSDDTRLVVELEESEYGVAPGQACVFFESELDESRVLGGGWIHDTASFTDQIDGQMTQGDAAEKSVA